MNARYFPDSDMLYIRLAEGDSTESEEVSPDVVFDFDAAGKIVGIEIEHASAHVDVARIGARVIREPRPARAHV